MAKKPLHDCPPYCHRCPDLDGSVMPACWGGAANWHREDDEVLARCHCFVEVECDRELARRLAQSRFLPPELRDALLAFARETARPDGSWVGEAE